MTQVAFFHIGENDIFPAILVRSIRAHNPDATILQCSDLNTPQVEGTDTVQRFEGDVANVMGFRTACFSRLEIDAPTIFLDTDMVCLQSLDLPEILGDNDIAVCRRQFETKEIIEINFMGMNLAEYSGKALGQVWPYIGCATITKSADFWIDCLQNLIQLPAKFHFWYGDQEAIRNVVASKKYKTTFLPESVYACPPETQPLYGNVVKLLHFKGADRKQMMIDYANKMHLLPISPQRIP